MGVSSRATLSFKKIALVVEVSNFIELQMFLGKMSFSEYACKIGGDNWVGVEKNPDKKGVMVCGSLGEVANNLTFGTANAFDLKSESTKKFNVDIYLFNEFLEYKKTVWANNALFDEGQLRQRLAFALYQIIPIGTPNTNTIPATEIWLQYYDIFVRVSTIYHSNVLDLDPI